MSVCILGVTFCGSADFVKDEYTGARNAVTRRRLQCSIVVYMVALLAGVACSGRNASTLPNEHDYVRAQLQRCKEPEHSKDGWHKLRAHVESHKTAWSDAYVYHLWETEFPLEAAMDYVSFVCFLRDRDVSEANQILSAFRLRRQDGDVRSVAFVLEERSSGEFRTYEKIWEDLRRRVYRVERSSVHEFVFEVDGGVWE